MVRYDGPIGSGPEIRGESRGPVAVWWYRRGRPAFRQRTSRLVIHAYLWRAASEKRQARGPEGFRVFALQNRDAILLSMRAGQC